MEKPKGYAYEEILDTESAVIVNKDPITIYAPWYGTLDVLTRQKVEED